MKFDYQRPFPWGKSDDIWISHVKVIQETIKKFRLTALKDEFLGPKMPVARKTAKSATALSYWGDDLPPWIWKYGGRKFAHLHFGDKIYALDEKQWAYFTDKVIQGFAAQLKNVKIVGVDRIVELGNVMSGIAHEVKLP